MSNLSTPITTMTDQFENLFDDAYDHAAPDVTEEQIRSHEQADGLISYSNMDPMRTPAGRIDEFQELRILNERGHLDLENPYDMEEDDNASPIGRTQERKSNEQDTTNSVDRNAEYPYPTPTDHIDQEKNVVEEERHHEESHVEERERANTPAFETDRPFRNALKSMRSLSTERIDNEQTETTHMIDKSSTETHQNPNEASKTHERLAHLDSISCPERSQVHLKESNNTKWNIGAENVSQNEQTRNFSKIAAFLDAPTVSGNVPHDRGTAHMKEPLEKSRPESNARSADTIRCASPKNRNLASLFTEDVHVVSDVLVQLNQIHVPNIVLRPRHIEDIRYMAERFYRCPVTFNQIGTLTVCLKDEAGSENNRVDAASTQREMRYSGDSLIIRRPDGNSYLRSNMSVWLLDGSLRISALQNDAKILDSLKDLRKKENRTYAFVSLVIRKDGRYLSPIDRLKISSLLNQIGRDMTHDCLHYITAYRSAYFHSYGSKISGSGNVQNLVSDMQSHDFLFPLRSRASYRTWVDIMLLLDDSPILQQTLNEHMAREEHDDIQDKLGATREYFSGYEGYENHRTSEKDKRILTVNGEERTTERLDSFLPNVPVLDPMTHRRYSKMGSAGGINQSNEIVGVSLRKELTSMFPIRLHNSNSAMEARISMRLFTASTPLFTSEEMYHAPKRATHNYLTYAGLSEIPDLERCVLFHGMCAWVSYTPNNGSSQSFLNKWFSESIRLVNELMETCISESNTSTVAKKVGILCHSLPNSVNKSHTTLSRLCETLRQFNEPGFASARKMLMEDVSIILCGTGDASDTSTQTGNDHNTGNTYESGPNIPHERSQILAIDNTCEQRVETEDKDINEGNVHMRSSSGESPRRSPRFQRFSINQRKRNEREEALRPHLKTVRTEKNGEEPENMNQSKSIQHEENEKQVQIKELLPPPPHHSRPTATAMKLITNAEAYVLSTSWVRAVRSPFNISDTTREVESVRDASGNVLTRKTVKKHLLAGMIPARHAAVSFFLPRDILRIRRLLMRLCALQFRNVVNLENVSSIPTRSSGKPKACSISTVEKNLVDSGAIALDGTIYLQTMAGKLHALGSVIFSGILSARDAFEKSAWDLLLGTSFNNEISDERPDGETNTDCGRNERIEQFELVSNVPSKEDIVHLWDTVSTCIAPQNKEQRTTSPTPGPDVTGMGRVEEHLDERGHRARATLDVFVSWILTAMNCDNDYQSRMFLHSKGGRFLSPYNGEDREEPYFSFSPPTSPATHRNAQRSPGYVAICTGVEGLAVWVAVGSHHHIQRNNQITTELKLDQVFIPPYSVFYAHGQIVMAAGANEDMPLCSSGRFQYYTRWIPEHQSETQTTRVPFGMYHGSQGSKFRSASHKPKQGEQQDDALLATKHGACGNHQGEARVEIGSKRGVILEDSPGHRKRQRHDRNISHDKRDITKGKVARLQERIAWMHDKPSPLVRHETEFPDIPYD